MSKSNRLARSLAVATVTMLLIATAAFAQSTAFSSAPAGTWPDKLDITNVGVLGDHEDVWEDADDGDADRDEIDDQVGDDDQGEDADDQGEDADGADEVEVEAPERAGANEQHATPDTAPKAGTGDEDDDQGEDNDDQGEDNDAQDEVEDHDGSHDGDHDDGDDDNGESDDGGGDD